MITILSGVIAAIFGVFAGLIGLVAGLFGLTIGIGAMSILFLPVILIALIPVLIVVVILRRLGLVRGRFGSFAAMLIGLFLLAGAAQQGWRHHLYALPGWPEIQQYLMDACKDSEDATVDQDGKDVHITCHAGHSTSKPAAPAKDGTDI